VFYKHFVKPIEKTLVEAGSGDNVGFANAKAADTYGVELEAKLNLGRLTSRLSAFTVGGNLSLIRSKIDLDGASRPLQGQSPYVLNLGLGYESESSGTQVDVLYNAFGARIDEVGTGGAGNVYEQPIHRLDITFSKKLPNRLKLKLAGTNLLGARVVRLQNGVEIFAYQQGVTVAGSLEMSID
jgi:outer membrane receptor protein involved in Fe transport